MTSVQQPRSLCNLTTPKTVRIRTFPVHYRTGSKSIILQIDCITSL